MPPICMSHSVYFLVSILIVLFLKITFTKFKNISSYVFFILYATQNKIVHISFCEQCFWCVIQLKYSFYLVNILILTERKGIDNDGRFYTVIYPCHLLPSFWISRFINLTCYFRSYLCGYPRKRYPSYGLKLYLILGVVDTFPFQVATFFHCTVSFVLLSNHLVIFA